MTTTATGPGRAAITARTLRVDRWWFPPLVTFVGLGAWVAYATVRVFLHENYWSRPTTTSRRSTRRA